MQKRITLQPSFDYKVLFKSLFSNISHKKFIISNSARSSFDLCLETAKAGDKYKNILIPDFICSEIIPIIHKYNMNIIFYNIDSELNPDIDLIENNIKSNPCILLVVNYFGKPSNWKSVFELKDKYNFLTIEDNAHSLYGRYKDIDFGNLGDISFNSLRKVLPVLSGSTLKFNENMPHNINLERRFINFSEFKYSLRNLKLNSIKNVSMLKDDKKSVYDDILSIDYLSYKIFLYLEGKRDEMSYQRKVNYNYWSKFLGSSSLEKIDISAADCPYAAPYIYNDIGECNKWLSWGRIHKINIIKWPSFPNIATHNLKNKKFERVLLFPVNHMFDLNNMGLKNAQN